MCLTGKINLLLSFSSPYSSTDKTNKSKIYIHETIKNTAQTIKKKVNTSTRITKTPTQLLKHQYITKQVKTNTAQDTHQMK